MSGEGGVVFATASKARFIVVAGGELRDPVVADGPFVMSSRAQIADTARRYQAGELGHLAPYSEL